MRFLFGVAALVGAVFALSFAQPAAARDWNATVAKLPSGAYLIGNPAAKVKLVEYLSYSCPHCAAFRKESAAVLHGQYIRSGSTSLEIRNQVHDQLDLAIALLAQCAGPKRFESLMNAFYDQQDTWLSAGINFEQDNGRRLAMYPAKDRLKTSAEGAGIPAIAVQHGMTRAEVDSCLASDAPMQAITKMMQAAPKEITGTPGFIVNGKIATNVYDWAHLQPILRAAGAR
jgi:protein-disulfide isomerase